MKKIVNILLTTALLAVTSCSLFLEKPDTTGTVDQEAVFSTTKNARAALMSCYRNVLRHGWPGWAAATTGTAATTSPSRA